MILMANTVRNPMLNDLVMNPSETGVLHECGHMADAMTGSKSGIGFSFEWMLAFPYLVDDFYTVDDTGVVELAKIQVPTLPYKCGVIEPGLVSWNTIPFCWASWTRRKSQISIVNVKSPTPCKFTVVWTPVMQGFHDKDGRRNLLKEFDVTLDRRHTFELSGVYNRAKKLSSTLFGIVLSSVLKKQVLPIESTDDVLRDGVFHILQNFPVQRGMIYPTMFKSFVFESFAGTELDTIVSPSAAAQLPGTVQILSRYVAGGETNADWLYAKNFP